MWKVAGTGRERVCFSLFLLFNANFLKRKRGRGCNISMEDSYWEVLSTQ